MSFYVDAKSNYAPRQLIKAKPQIARIYQVIDLGVQSGGQYADCRKVLITWEFPNDLILEGEAKGKPLASSQTLPIKFGTKAKLRLDLLNPLLGLDPAENISGYDLGSLVGKTALLMISHKSDPKNPAIKYANISGVSQIPEEMQIPDAINDPVILNLDEFDQEVFDKLPEWVRKKIDSRVTSIPVSTGKVAKGSEF